eukprot:gene33500-2404_t
MRLVGACWGGDGDRPPLFRRCAEGGDEEEAELMRGRLLQALMLHAYA